MAHAAQMFSFGSTGRAARPARGLPTPRHVMREVILAWRRRSTRRILIDLDDRLLADIGVEPGDVPHRPLPWSTDLTRG